MTTASPAAAAAALAAAVAALAPTVAALALLLAAPAVSSAEDYEPRIPAETVQPGRAAPATPAPPAPAPPVPSAKSAKAPARPNVLLWKLTSRSATVYVLGSIHVASADLYPLDPRIRDAFHNSTVLLTELDVSPIGKEQSKRLLEAYGTYPEGESLEQHLDPTTRAALIRIVEERKQTVDLSKIWKMRPWFAYLTLTNQAFAEAGYKSEWGIEEHLRRMAGQRKVETLESMLDQVKIFHEMPLDAQLASLRHAINNMGELALSVKRAQEAWKLGDAQRINDLVVEPLRKANPMLYDRLFLERNRKMADVIERHLNSAETAFIVVGSGHLIGQDSILKMLDERGYKATQL